MRKNKVIFIKNAFILTVTSLLIRFIGMVFRVWLASAVGAEGMGLYSQVFSFYMLACAFATTGINTAVTRMVSEELSLGNDGGVKSILSKCIGVTLVIAICSSLLVFFGAEFIANTIIGDKRAVGALKALTISLAFMGMSSCFKGYFIARKKTAPASSSQVFEQLIRIGLVFYLVGKNASKGIGAACQAVILGDSVAEIFSFIYVYISYVFDKKRHLSSKGGKPEYSVLSRLSHIALPITLGRYANSILRTCENVLVPRQLEKSGLSSSDALSVFGIIKGMALPLIFFPASFLNAISTLLIPEMSEAAVGGRQYKVRYTAEKCIHITLFAAFPLAVIFFYAAKPLGELFYGEAQAGEVIRLLSPIIPLMYMDSVCDGLLKGLDKQFFIFRNSMIDSLCRIALIMLIVPKYSLEGFIGIMYLSNAFTCIMNFFKLKRVSQARVNWFRWLVLPSVCALCIGTAVYLILDIFSLPRLAFVLCFSIPTAAIYLLVAVKLKLITREDLK